MAVEWFATPALFRSVAIISPTTLPSACALALIRDDLRRAGLEKQIPAGFILAGGGAKLTGLFDLVEQTFHLPVRIAEPKGLADLPEQVAQPEYATVVGLVLYGAKTRRATPQRAGNLVSKLKSMFAGAS